MIVNYTKHTQGASRPTGRLCESRLQFYNRKWGFFNRKWGFVNSKWGFFNGKWGFVKIGNWPGVPAGRAPGMSARACHTSHHYVLLKNLHFMLENLHFWVHVLKSSILNTKLIILNTEWIISNTSGESSQAASVKNIRPFFSRKLFIFQPKILQILVKNLHLYIKAHVKKHRAQRPRFGRSRGRQSCCRSGQSSRRVSLQKQSSQEKLPELNVGARDPAAPGRGSGDLCSTKSSFC